MTTFKSIGNYIKASQGILQLDLSIYYKQVAEIRAFHKTLETDREEALQIRASNLKKKIRKGMAPKQLLIEAYALVLEVCKRILGPEAYDVQLIGAIALHEGKLIEMKTGEGKTLAAVFPAFLQALSGKGVHIMTFNDYLARRDAEWMAGVYQFLGLSVASINEDMTIEEKRKAYAADITYGTAKEIGFDYLRSFIAYQESELVLRPFHFAIIDEADALLIDEARNPLVLAGDILETTIDPQEIAALAAGLRKEKDFEINKYSRNVFITEQGMETLEKKLNITNLASAEHNPLLSAINLALHARELLKKDIDYVIRDNSIKLVDELTGRIVADRKWRNGLQTAVEAKEGLSIQNEGNILNSITIQHFILQYPKRAGMTATAHQSIEHFLDHYGMKVLVIPPNKSNQRIDHADRIFNTKKAKYEALIKEIKTVHETGRPILVGTLTVKESEELADLIGENAIPCNVLNAKNDELEAGIIAEAGKLGAVTISTNMAGRGTDILLGGKDQKQRAQVIELGGLYVIGTNRHESERIDMQLRGRSGRQGDVGSSRFFISLEDDLMLRYQLASVLPRKYKALKGDIEIREKGIRKFVSHIQKVIEDQSSELRRTLGVYNQMTEQQRKIVQSERQQLLLEQEVLISKIKSKAKQEHLSPNLTDKIKTAILFHYDRTWAMHLDDLQQVKEGIYMVRFGGQHPLHEFQKISDEIFQIFLEELDESIENCIKKILMNPDITIEELGIRKPSSTWTYVVNDNPFGNKLATMLLGNGNIGMQIDFISNFILALRAIFKKIKDRKK